MASRTRNTVLIQARKRVDELAANRREREQTLNDLATEYLVETMTADRLVDDAEAAAAKLVSDAKNAAAVARERAKTTIVKMLATGETRSGVAELLDVSLSYVRGIDVASGKGSKIKDSSPDQVSDNADESARSAEVGSGQG